MAASTALDPEHAHGTVEGAKAEHAADNAAKPPTVKLNTPSTDVKNDLKVDGAKTEHAADNADKQSTVKLNVPSTDVKNDPKADGAKTEHAADNADKQSTVKLNVPSTDVKNDPKADGAKIEHAADNADKQSTVKLNGPSTDVKNDPKADGAKTEHAADNADKQSTVKLNSPSTDVKSDPKADGAKTENDGKAEGIGSASKEHLQKAASASVASSSVDVKKADASTPEKQAMADHDAFAITSNGDISSVNASLAKADEDLLSSMQKHKDVNDNMSEDSGLVLKVDKSSRPSEDDLVGRGTDRFDLKGAEDDDLKFAFERDSDSGGDDDHFVLRSRFEPNKDRRPSNFPYGYIDGEPPVPPWMAKRRDDSPPRLVRRSRSPSPSTWPYGFVAGFDLKDYPSSARRPSVSGFGGSLFSKSSSSRKESEDNKADRIRVPLRFDQELELERQKERDKEREKRWEEWKQPSFGTPRNSIGGLSAILGNDSDAKDDRGSAREKPQRKNSLLVSMLGNGAEDKDDRGSAWETPSLGRQRKDSLGLSSILGNGAEDKDDAGTSPSLGTQRRDSLGLSSILGNGAEDKDDAGISLSFATRRKNSLGLSHILGTGAEDKDDRGTARDTLGLSSSLRDKDDEDRSWMNPTRESLGLSSSSLGKDAEDRSIRRDGDDATPKPRWKELERDEELETRKRDKFAEAEKRSREISMALQEREKALDAPREEPRAHLGGGRNDDEPVLQSTYSSSFAPSKDDGDSRALGLQPTSSSGFARSKDDGDSRALKSSSVGGSVSFSDKKEIIEFDTKPTVTSSEEDATAKFFRDLKANESDKEGKEADEALRRLLEEDKDKTPEEKQKEEETFRKFLEDINASNPPDQEKAEIEDFRRQLLGDPDAAPRSTLAR